MSAKDESRLEIIEKRQARIELMLAAILSHLEANNSSATTKEQIASGKARGLSAAEIIEEHNARADRGSL